MKSLAVRTWPDPAPTPQDGLFAILVDTAEAQAGAAGRNSAENAGEAGNDSAANVGEAARPGQAPGARRQREASRYQLRLAACEALAAVLRVPAGDVRIVSHPGEPPAILLAGRASTIGISFSHDDRYSVAAFNLQGPIGADVMRVQDIPDWQAVAGDYLGPAVSVSLQALPTAERPQAFTQAWTQREAALKCHAQQLSEWQAELPGRSITLLLPVPGLAGYIHIGDNNA